MSVRLVCLIPRLEQLVQRRGRERGQRVLAEVAQVVRRLRAVELVLEPQRDDRLVDERVAQAADLHVVAAPLGTVALVADVGHLQAAALGRRPDADHGVGGRGGDDTAPLRVTCASGTCRTTDCTP